MKNRIGFSLLALACVFSLILGWSNRSRIRQNQEKAEALALHAILSRGELFANAIERKLVKALNGNPNLNELSYKKMPNVSGFSRNHESLLVELESHFKFNRELTNGEFVYLTNASKESGHINAWANELYNLGSIGTPAHVTQQHDVFMSPGAPDTITVKFTETYYKY